MSKKAVLLLSGGLDSATTCAIATSDRYAVYALSFDYGQRHNIELAKAIELAKDLNVAEHKIVKIDLRLFGGSALTDNIEVPKNRDTESKDIPVTYVPARNTIFLSYALAYAETIKAYDIFIGANILDYSGYPDCRPEYLKAYEDMANLATAATINTNNRIKINAPLINMSKAEIIKTGLELGLDYSKTISCYDPDINGRPCGQCDSCRLRNKGFAQNGITDPSL
ncbi:MAG: 7-cyano-7-deazaguanine synthase QueC [Rickettsiales bacterium]|nr:7-cyano-7-deazaguanine synthase QueC [Pseudomonadota bacterium]MDA0965379.1 7-cyano-7-deazaguanine synthase QueC [Pseudomonadota bacterium]MDG4544307.1 7-cyano-7-deazaguanine synthase QueC [Rickettsiales bacterium]MDG4544848.1 7-cyano-7-deazaguanine synthase QueC [Rickettsiales bacterium]MDG4546970.1 7-cyano-7-deazaguanine synthase QueC [Rickettsiales bacterium]